MHRLLILSGLLLVAGLASMSCGDGFTQQHSFVQTSTIPLGRQTTLVVDSPVALVVRGHPRSTDLVYELDATVTASTVLVARELSEGITITTEDLEPSGIQLIVSGVDFRNGRLEGTLEVTVPQDMDLVAVGRGGPLEVHDIAGNLDIDAATHVVVTGAEGSVDVGVERGNAIVTASALPGSNINLRTRTGDVQLVLPQLPSVSLQAQAGGGGGISVLHRRLPPYVGGGLPYGAVVGGGLSQVLLTTEIGNIVIASQ